MRSSFVVLSVATVLSSWSLAGCGSDGGGSESCSGSPCGGDVVGTWNVTDYCFNAMEAVAEACPQAKISMDLSASGMVQYTSNGTYTSSLTLSGNASSTLPPACLMFQGLTLTCEQVNQLYAARMAEPDFPFSSASCSAAGTSCRCAFTLRPMVSNETGTYSVSGTTLSMTNAADGMTEVVEYCASGNGSTLQILETNMMGGGVTAGLILKK